MFVGPTPLEMEELEDLLMEFGIMEMDDEENRITSYNVCYTKLLRQGYQWLLKVIDPAHTVRVIFSPDEIEMFAEELPENRETKT